MQRSGRNNEKMGLDGKQRKRKWGKRMRDERSMKSMKMGEKSKEGREDEILNNRRPVKLRFRPSIMSLHYAPNESPLQ